MTSLRRLAAAAGVVAESAPATAGRPRIGLVLADAGAEGGVHVGVLKVFEELQVPIDCIAGTSMGALVGAGYASCLSARKMEEFLTGRTPVSPLTPGIGATSADLWSLWLSAGRPIGHGGNIMQRGIFR